MAVPYIQQAAPPMVVQMGGRGRGGNQGAVLAQLMQQQAQGGRQDELLLLQMLMADQADKRQREQFEQTAALRREELGQSDTHFNLLLNEQRASRMSERDAILDQIKAQGAAQVEAIRAGQEPLIKSNEYTQKMLEEARNRDLFNTAFASAKEGVTGEATSAIERGRATTTKQASDIERELANIQSEANKKVFTSEDPGVFARMSVLGGTLFVNKQAEKLNDLLSSALQSDNPARRQAAIVFADQKRNDLRAGMDTFWPGVPIDTGSDIRVMNPLKNILDSYADSVEGKELRSKVRGMEGRQQQSELDIAALRDAKLNEMRQQAGTVAGQQNINPYLWMFGIGAPMMVGSPSDPSNKGPTIKQLPPAIQLAPMTYDEYKRLVP